MVWKKRIEPVKRKEPKYLGVPITEKRGKIHEAKRRNRLLTREKYELNVVH